LIWSAPVPNKVKIFGWRTACDNLATKKNKLKRKLETDGICALCGCEDETSYHATVACTKARALRQEMRKSWEIPNERCFKFTGPDWLLILLDGLNSEKRGLLLMLLWRCWHLRNDAVHDKGECSIKGSAIFLNRYINELNLNCKRGGSEKGKGPMVEEGNRDSGRSTSVTVIKLAEPVQRRKWTPPPSGWLKINCDASFDSENAICSIACICRDQVGKVIWARNESNLRCIDVPEAEAKACLLGLKSIHDPSKVSIILESDSAIVVEAIKRRNQSKSRLWRLYEDISKLQESCIQCEISEIGRESNSAAHILADTARLNGINQFWLGIVPTVVAEIVEAEIVKLNNDVI
jgi:ribonuclease HI